MNRDKSSSPAGAKISRSAKKAAVAGHRSIAALMREALPGESAEDVIRRKCRAMVALGKSFGWDGPPFDPEILAGLHGIRVEPSLDEFEGDGRIFPRRGKVVIQYRAGRMVERQRFTICHELAHTCFPDVYEFVRSHSASSEDDPAHREFEHLCDFGASELLFPHEPFLQHLGSAAVCMRHATGLASQFVASTDATLKRIMDMTAHSCAAVFLTDGAFKEFPVARGQMRVRWMWKSKSFKGFLKQGTLLPRGICIPGSCSEKADSFPKGRQTWWINGRPFSWYVEPLALPAIPGSPEYPRVVALLHSRKP